MAVTNYGETAFRCLARSCAHRSSMEDDILETHPVNVQIILRNGILPTLLDVVSSTVDVDLISEYSGACPHDFPCGASRELTWVAVFLPVASTVCDGGTRQRQHHEGHSESASRAVPRQPDRAGTTLCASGYVPQHAGRHT